MAVKRLLPATALFSTSTFGNKFCWKQRGIHIRGWAFQVKVCANQMLSNVGVTNAELSRNFWIGACSEWQKIAWKVQSKNNCKGNYWCVKKHPVGLSCFELKASYKLRNYALWKSLQLHHFCYFECVHDDWWIFIPVAAPSVSCGKVGRSKLKEWLLHLIFS